MKVNHVILVGFQRLALNIDGSRVNGQLRPLRLVVHPGHRDR